MADKDDDLKKVAPGYEKDTEDVEDEVELEIIDDTPEKDRGRKPLESVEEPTDEELRTYSEDVKKRINELTHARHDERRAKEALARERDELDRVSRALAAENQRLKGFVQTGQKVYGDTLKEAALAEVENAKAALKAAHEEFDTDAIVEAQNKLFQAQLKLDKAENFVPPLQTQETDVQTHQPTSDVPRPDRKTLSWQARNQWFGQDEEMTASAMMAHKRLVASGVDPRTDEYFSAIDAHMKKRFPEFFEDSAPVRQQSTGKRAPDVVAPVSKAAGPKKVSLTKTQVAVAKKLGIPLEAYAKQVQLLEVGNG